LYWKVDTHFRVEGGNFYPRPKVDAEVLRFIPRPDPVCEVSLRPIVIEVIRAGFSTRRKTMHNALSSGLKISRESSEAILAQAAVDPAWRAESMGLSEFVRVARAVASSPDLRAGLLSALAPSLSSSFAKQGTPGA
jgi:16S rRNA (adenine1518-N6/adenine1519-N6)-dimethyltransferase